MTLVLNNGRFIPIQQQTFSTIHIIWVLISRSVVTKEIHACMHAQVCVIIGVEYQDYCMAMDQSDCLILCNRIAWN